MVQPNTPSPIWNRAVGTLLGSAAGDALGAGYEFTYPRPGAAISMIGGGPFNFAPCEWTDDTSMAVGIAQVAATGVDLRTTAALDAIAANWVKWYDSHPQDIGNQTRSVLSKRDSSAAAMTATAAAIRGNRKGGNGSLMRTGPVALAYIDKSGQDAMEAAALIGQMTHDDKMATQACMIWTYAIHHAIRFGTFDGVWLAVGEFSADDGMEWGKLLSDAEATDPSSYAGTNGWVVTALQTAWSAITRSDPDTEHGHLERALVACVRAGGDTDTTAAIAGALLGAVHGMRAIPAEWTNKLHGYPNLTTKDLIDLALSAATKAVPA